MAVSQQETVVVVGSGMTALTFCDRLIAMDDARRYRIVAVCEESRAAYDRMGLTTFSAHRDAEKRLHSCRDLYESAGAEIHFADRATEIDRRRKFVYTRRGMQIPYSKVVLATGSIPCLPEICGKDKSGVFLYRTPADLGPIRNFAHQCRTCVVTGGGLRGLESARAVRELGLKTHVVDSSERLLPEQLDAAGSRILENAITDSGVQLHLGKTTREALGQRRIERIAFSDHSTLTCDMLIIAAGICPQNDVAVRSELDISDNGGVVVDEFLRTSDPDICAIGECAEYGKDCHGFVGLGDVMAETVAANLCGDSRRFRSVEQAATRHLPGIDLALFGIRHRASADSHYRTFADSSKNIYRRLVYSMDRRRLLGGTLIGDTTDLRRLSNLAMTSAEMSDSPLAADGRLIFPRTTTDEQS